jgi:hypothetical protein
VASAIAVAVVVFLVLTTYWQQRLPVFSDAPKLMSAMQAYSRDLTARGRSLPDAVSLRELVSGGYLAAGDVHAFDGMEVTISLKADAANPQEVLIRVRFSDGSVTALMADGSVQSLRR